MGKRSISRRAYKSDIHVTKLVNKIEHEVNSTNNNSTAKAIKKERDRIAKEFKEKGTV